MAVNVSKVMTKVFGSRNERMLRRYQKVVDQINLLEPGIRAQSDVQLRERTQELRRQLTSGKIRSAEVMPEAFAIIRESMDRNIGIRSIFDPDNNFDPDQFDDEMLEAYDSVQRSLISTGVSWRQVPLPPKIYDGVRKLYPDSRPPFTHDASTCRSSGAWCCTRGRSRRWRRGRERRRCARWRVSCGCSRGIIAMW